MGSMRRYSATGRRHWLLLALLTDSCGETKSLVEVDQGFDDPILFGLHHPECPFDLIEAELVCGHRRGVHLTGLHQSEDPAHPVAAPGAQPTVDLLISHPHSKRLQRYLQRLWALA